MRVHPGPCTWLGTVFLVGLLGSGQAADRQGTTILDSFEDLSGWSAHPADGVELAIHSDAGAVGKAMRLDFRFLKGGGYAVARKALAFDLPENYRLSFRIRGEAPSNHIEVKLIDATGENVWWSVRRDYSLPSEWELFTVRKRQVSFAWGPVGGGEIRSVAAMELAITAGSGGEGSVWIDELTLQSLPPAPATTPRPIARASSARKGAGAERAIDGDPATAWSATAKDHSPRLQLDLGYLREYGGLVLDWAEGRGAADYAVSISEDGKSWRAIRTVKNGNGGRDYLYLPETESRFLRIGVARPGDRGEAGEGKDSPAEQEVALAEVAIQPIEWSASRESFFQAIARDAPRGSYPRGFSNEQSYWTVVGVDHDTQEVLMNEDGAIETGKRAFSIEPFVALGDRLWTWSDVRADASLAEGWMPAPIVRWPLADIDLTVSACGFGPPESSAVAVRYRLRNRGASAVPVVLYLAIRPFQVNPPSQTLNTPGGTAPIADLAFEDGWVRANAAPRVRCLTPPDAFGAVAFDQGDIVVDYLRRGEMPASGRADDPFAAASGALAYRRTLQPGDSADVDLRIPLHGEASILPEEPVDCARSWAGCTGSLKLDLPPEAGDLLKTFRAQLAYIFVNRAGPAIQPGTRAYARSWIRDGALTSSALLRVGCPEPAREFMEWFAVHQYDNGKIPCVVDARGSDPVPEHDSSGEFIFLVAEYTRYTGDREALARMWPRVKAAAAYLDSLRQERRTPEYERPENRRFFGILPPSISHEGYSAKPMHSYWDDFFALRGFRDAVHLAGEMRDEAALASLTRIRDEFERDLSASIAAAMEHHAIDFIPGCADLGDFDATSTAIAVSPIEAMDVLPPGALERTFERYWEFFVQRKESGDWDAYTPYEMRTIGPFARLGWRARAHELLAWFLAHRRPIGWRQWAEVVAREERVPRFLGDMPHTWVGSEFVRSFLDLFAFTREADRSIVIGAGIPEAWARADGGVSVRDLPTPYGPLSYSIVMKGGTFEVRIDGGLKLPPGGVVVRAPFDGPKRAFVNHRQVNPAVRGDVRVRAVPAVVWLRPA